MVNLVNHEGFKSIAEKSLTACRHFQSKQTGYIHLNYSDSDAIPQTIPIVENVLFCYALFRSRSVEQITEAKNKLKNLLSFQLVNGNEEGNFPQYLHDFPNSSDPSIGIQLLAPLYWMIKQFDTVLGGELRDQIHLCVLKIFSYSLKKDTTKPFPYFLKIRLYAALWAFGELFKNEEWEKNGKEILEKLSIDQLADWSTTKQLGDILVGLQMRYPHLSQSPWVNFWKRMEETWHAPLCAYMGPCFREWEEGEEPKATLYDLYCGYFAGSFSERSLALKEHLIHSILIQPSDHFKPFCPGLIQEKHWQTVAESHYAITLLEKVSEINPAIENTYTPFRFIWGDLVQFHSIVFQGSHYQKVTFSTEEKKIILTCELKETHQDQKREIEFFINGSASPKWRVENSPMTLFQLGQRLEINCQLFDFFFTFELLEGEGRFVGHVMRGNRPSQIDLRGDKRYQAYDWTFFIRSIRRQPRCILKVIIEYLKK